MVWCGTEIPRIRIIKDGNLHKKILHSIINRRTDRVQTTETTPCSDPPDRRDHVAGCTAHMRMGFVGIVAVGTVAAAAEGSMHLHRKLLRRSIHRHRHHQQLAD